MALFAYFQHYIISSSQRLLQQAGSSPKILRMLGTPQLILQWGHERELRGFVLWGISARGSAQMTARAFACLRPPAMGVCGIGRQRNIPRAQWFYLHDNTTPAHDQPVPLESLPGLSRSLHQLGCLGLHNASVWYKV